MKRLRDLTARLLGKEEMEVIDYMLLKPDEVDKEKISKALDLRGLFGALKLPKLVDPQIVQMRLRAPEVPLKAPDNRTRWKGKVEKWNQEEGGDRPLWTDATILQQTLIPIRGKTP